MYSIMNFIFPHQHTRPQVAFPQGPAGHRRLAESLARDRGGRGPVEAGGAAELLHQSGAQLGLFVTKDIVQISNGLQLSFRRAHSGKPSIDQGCCLKAGQFD
jgi:hypothetical protein